MKRKTPENLLFAVWNPLPPHRMVGKRRGVLADRTPLVYSTSSDEGKTWTDPVTIEDNKNTGFSYTAIHFTPETILLAYFIEFFEGNRLRKRALRMREIPVSDIP